MYADNNQTKTSGVALDLVINGLLIALVFISTKFINIRLPIAVNGGLIHLGNVPLFIAAIAFGPRVGAIAGGVGMAIFDITSGWALWAPFTLVVRATMGYIIGHISAQKQGHSIWLNSFAILVGTLWMLVGYYFTEVLLYGNWLTPFTSIPGNLLQTLLSALIVLPTIPKINKIVRETIRTNR